MTDNKYYLFLERLRRSGKTNMCGAGKYLMKKFGLDRKTASKVLINWIKNYNQEDYR